MTAVFDARAYGVKTISLGAPCPESNPRRRSRVLASLKEALDISGKAGEPVLASPENGLIFVIFQCSAFAHNAKRGPGRLAHMMRRRLAGRDFVPCAQGIKDVG